MQEIEVARKHGSHIREFMLQALTLLAAGRMQRAGEWVKISKRG